MKVPLSWLKDYVDWPWGPEELAERLTMAGVHVEIIEKVGEGVRGVIAARVLNVVAHPNPASGEKDASAAVDGASAAGEKDAPAAGDGLGRHWVVDLDAGGQRRQAVAGIANMKPGDVVAYAPPGATLPGEWRITVANVRGVTSEGMLLSLSELVLGEKPKEGEGVLVLPPDLAPGADLALVLGLPETVLELDLTPNYAAHCQSLIGVAREVAALTGAGPSGVRYPDPHALLRPAGAAAAESCRVSILAPDLCPRYVARVIRGVKLGPSPWLVQFRVLAAGMRPITNIVDATNYVMLEYGQPLHAFDLGRLDGRHIVVRRAVAGEGIVTLDGVSRTLAEDTLVIADERRAVAVAGVMGGEDSEVRAGTRDILLESAGFEPISVRRAAARLGLPSEASGRFDKGTDPGAVEPASARAAALIAEIAGGAVAPGSVDANPVPYRPREVALRTSRVSALMGVGLEATETASYLRLLGFEPRPAAWVPDQGGYSGEGPDPAGGSGGRPGDGRGGGSGRPAAADLLVTVPAWRTDVADEADLVEEVARLYGYDRIPETLPGGAATVGTLPRRTRLENRARRLFVGYGFSETVSLSLVDPETDPLLGPAGAGPLILANPLSVRQSAMRTGLLAGLVDCVARNLDRAERRLRLFEIGATYHPAGGELGPANLPHERRFLAALALGPGPEVSWRDPGREPDFYYAKGLVVAALRELGVAGYRFARGGDRRFHPGRQAMVEVLSEAGSNDATVEVGVFGELHPRVLGLHDITERVVAIEIDLDAASRASTADTQAQEGLRHPVVTRDVAIVLPENVEAATIESVITTSAGDLCAEVELFDLYRGHPVPGGQRSTAWRVTYRSADRSLTDAEVDEVHARVRQALERELGATLR